MIMFPKESSSQDFGDLTDGCAPGTLSYAPWEFFDEFGEPCQAILTHDVVNAPHKFTFGARKVTRMNAPILLATEAVHPAQGPEQYEASCATVATQIKKWGCKITTVQEITDRLDNYHGANIEKKTDVQYSRGALRRSFPPVPQALCHASPTSQAPSPQSGFNPLGQHSAGMAQSPPPVRGGTSRATTRICQRSRCTVHGSEPFSVYSQHWWAVGRPCAPQFTSRE